MSTSLIYHAFGLRGYDYVRQDFIAGNIILKVQSEDDLVRCPCCRSRNIIRHGFAERWVQTVPIGFKPVWLVIPVQRVGCHNCGVVRLIDMQITDTMRSYTKALERYALALAKKMTMQDVAALLGVGWDTVKSIFKRYRDLCAAKTTHFLFNQLIRCTILSSFKGGRHGDSTEGTSAG